MNNKKNKETKDEKNKKIRDWNTYLKVVLEYSKKIERYGSCKEESITEEKLSIVSQLYLKYPIKILLKVSQLSKSTYYYNISKNDKDDVKLEDVDEITNIKINRRKPSNEILAFLMKAKNPYIFKVNGKLVRIRFSNADKTTDDCFTKVLENLYRWKRA